MYYVELLFARTVLSWQAVLMLAMAAAFTIFVTWPPIGAHVRNVGQDVPFDPVLIGAAWVASIVSSIVGTTLNRDHGHLAYIWTKPVARARVALSYILVDVAAILASFGITVAIVAAVFAVPPSNHMLVDDQTLPILVRGLAVPFMIYGILEVVTSWNPARMAQAIGIFWGGAWLFVILGAVGLPGVYGFILSAVNTLNPLTYFPEYNGHGIHILVNGATVQSFAMSFAVRTIFAYAVFVVGCAVAIVNWQRMEA